MQITVTIPDEFAAQARARGLTPEGYVESLIEDAVRVDPAAPPPAKRKRDIEAFFRGMAAYSDKYSSTSRRSLYPREFLSGP